MSILITYAEEGGESTLIVRLAIAHELINAGHDVDLYPCDRAPQVRDYDAVVVGSMIKHRRWQAEAVSFLRRNAADLADRPTYLFQTAGTAQDDQSEPAQNITHLTYQIGIAGPQTFDTVGMNPGEQRERAAAWGRQVGRDLNNRLEGLTSGMWAPLPTMV